MINILNKLTLSNQELDNQTYTPMCTYKRLFEGILRRKSI